MVAMEGENILHHVKGRGIVQEGEISGGICPGKYFQGGGECPRIPVQRTCTTARYVITPIAQRRHLAAFWLNCSVPALVV